VPKNKLRIRFPELFEYQKKALYDPRPFKVLDWGAQSGKTRFSLYTQAAFVLSSGVTAGENLWVTRDGKFARDEFRLAGALLPKEFIRESNRSDLFYRLTNGQSWWFYSGLEPDAFRGRKWTSVVFNEASYCRPEGWTEVVAPRLRGWALFNFTPKGLRNWSYTELWQRAAQESARWFRSTVTSFENPTNPRENLEEARRHMPDAAYRQEILAEFVSDFGQFFSPAPRCWQGAFEPFEPKARYAAGLDWAKIRDFSALAIRRIDVFPHRLVYVERLPHMNYTEQVPIIANRLKAYGNPPCFADSSEATANELLQNVRVNVEEFAFTGPSKQHICDAQRIEFEQAAISMPATESKIRGLVEQGLLPVGTKIRPMTEEQAVAAAILEDEIASFEPYLQGGKLKLGARGQNHDDVIIAVMLSGEAARTGGGSGLPFMSVAGKTGATIMR